VRNRNGFKDNWEAKDTRGEGEVDHRGERKAPGKDRRSNEKPTNRMDERAFYFALPTQRSNQTPIFVRVGRGEGNLHGGNTSSRNDNSLI